MVRVCINRHTGILMEAQSGGETQAHLDTLTQNAIAAGYPAEEIEVKFVSDEEFRALLADQQEAAMTYADKRRGEYPDFRDYLDGIVKGDTVQVQRYINECLAVKAKYPKG